jgi:REP element-mobilizing transposase RayT
MARQLRIEYPGAFYHVYSRGNRKQEIFLSDEDRYFFLKVLGDASEGPGVRFHAYCLMPNHYHLFIETPFGGLSRALHLINTAYTVYFNKKNSRCGHLYQGRFKSILVEAETYARELSRYIHLNPVRAGLVRRPEEYPWSSYREYLGMRTASSWLVTSLILGDSGIPSEKDRDCYARFVLTGMGCDPPSGVGDSKRSGILGSPSFIDRIKAEFLEGQISSRDRERPQLRFYRKRPEIRDILALSEGELGPHSRFVKGLAIFICKHIVEYPIGEIEAFYGMSVSGIYAVRRRIRKEMERNDALFRAYREIVRRLDDRPDKTDPPLLSESNEK